MQKIYSFSEIQENIEILNNMGKYRNEKKYRDYIGNIGPMGALKSVRWTNSKEEFDLPFELT